MAATLALRVVAGVMVFLPVRAELLSPGVLLRSQTSSLFLTEKYTSSSKLRRLQPLKGVSQVEYICSAAQAIRCFTGLGLHSRRRALECRRLVSNNSIEPGVQSIGAARCGASGGLSVAVEEAERGAIAARESSAKEGFMYSVEIKCRGDSADALVEALLCFGAQSCSVEDANLGNPSEQEIYSLGPIPWQEGPRQLWHESRLRALFPAHHDIASAVGAAAQSVGLAETPEFCTSEVADQDWVQQVQDMYEPVRVADGLWVLPHWCSLPEPDALAVVLDPGLAFGTGEHATTRLCLRLLKGAVQGGERLLDYGCGSGVLSIAALKMGAVRAVGVDIDPLAVRSTNHNATLNGFGASALQVFISSASGPDPVPRGAASQEVPGGSAPVDELPGADPSRGGEYDIVVANILLNPLLEMAERITGHARAGGTVGLSGILVEQVEKVTTTYAAFLEDMRVTEEDGWACIQGRRKS